MTAAATSGPEPGTLVLTGSSSGIGLAVTELFLETGWSVLGLDVSPAATTVAEHPRFATYAADVTDDASVGHAFAAIGRAGHRPDALVTAAGAYPATYLGRAGHDAFRTVFDLNVWGTVTACQHFLEVCADGASIVTIASRDAFVPQDNQFLYGASKAAVVHLTVAMATALVARGIRVNAVSPPRVATEALRALYGTMPEDAVPVEQITSIVLALVGRGPLSALNGQVVRVPGTGEVDA